MIGDRFLAGDCLRGLILGELRWPFERHQIVESRHQSSSYFAARIRLDTSDHPERSGHHQPGEGTCLYDSQLANQTLVSF